MSTGLDCPTARRRLPWILLAVLLVASHAACNSEPGGGTPWDVHAGSDAGETTADTAPGPDVDGGPSPDAGPSGSRCPSPEDSMQPSPDPSDYSASCEPTSICDDGDCRLDIEPPSTHQIEPQLEWANPPPEDGATGLELTPMESNADVTGTQHVRVGPGVGPADRGEAYAYPGSYRVGWSSALDEPPLFVEPWESTISVPDGRRFEVDARQRPRHEVTLELTYDGESAPADWTLMVTGGDSEEIVTHRNVDHDAGSITLTLAEGTYDLWFELTGAVRPSGPTFEGAVAGQTRIADDLQIDGPRTLEKDVPTVELSGELSWQGESLPDTFTDSEAEIVFERTDGAPPIPRNHVRQRVEAEDGTYETTVYPGTYRVRLIPHRNLPLADDGRARYDEVTVHERATIQQDRQLDFAVDLPEVGLSWDWEGPELGEFVGSRDSHDELKWVVEFRPSDGAEDRKVYHFEFPLETREATAPLPEGTYEASLRLSPQIGTARRQRDGEFVPLVGADHHHEIRVEAGCTIPFEMRPVEQQIEVRINGRPFSEAAGDEDSWRLEFHPSHAYEESMELGERSRRHLPLRVVELGEIDSHDGMDSRTVLLADGSYDVYVDMEDADQGSRAPPGGRGDSRTDLLTGRWVADDWRPSEDRLTVDIDRRIVGGTALWNGDPIPSTAPGGDDTQRAHWDLKFVDRATGAERTRYFFGGSDTWQAPVPTGTYDVHFRFRPRSTYGDVAEDQTSLWWRAASCVEVE